MKNKVKVLAVADVHGEIEKFVFNGVSYYVSNDWSARNKQSFDNWAARLAVQVGIPFEPYDIVGIASK